MMLLGTTPIVVQFSRAMAGSSLAISGDLAGEVASASWSQPPQGPYVLTLSPASPWAAGETRALTIAVDDTAGNPMEPLSLRYDVAGGTLVYVSAAAGDDSGDGLSPEAAKKSLQSALAAANAPASVLIAEGDHEPAGPGPFVLPAGVSLYGGFAAGFLSRDGGVHLSRIVGREPTSGTALVATAAMTATTVVDGLQFVAGNGTTNSIAVDISGAAAPLLRRNVFTAAKGANSAGAFAVALSVASGATIRGDVMRGGRAYFTAGIRVTAGSPLLADNVIDGGTASAIADGALVNGGAPLIVNNTIGGGAGDLYAFGIDSSQAQAVIENNVIFTTTGSYGRVCIIHDVGTAPPSVQNNDLFACPTALYASPTSGSAGTCSFNRGEDCHTILGEVNDAKAIGVGQAGGNVSSDPAFADEGSGDYHLTAASPQSVASGGRDRSDVIAIDRDGRTRTVPWSIGAYERD